MNAITYKEAFTLIKEVNACGLGMVPNGQRLCLFDVALQTMLRELVRNKKEGSAYKTGGWDCKGQMGNGCLVYQPRPGKKRHEDLILYKKYSPDEYPIYDNYDAINVNKTDHIPVDYAGEMGVPITFLDKHNPEQFEIIGMDRPLITQLIGQAE